MPIFKSFLFFELKRSLTKLNVIVLIVFFVVSMFLTLNGVHQYNEIKKSKEEFIKIEKLKIGKFNNYDQYGGYGFRLYFMPSVLSIFFSNTNLFTELTAHIDIGEKLNIDDSFKGKKVFSQKPGRWLDFSGILLLFGSLMALFYGYDALRHKEYLKFLASIRGSYGHWKVYMLLWFSRMTWLCLYFIIVTAAALAFALISGIIFTVSEYWHFLVFVVMILLVMAFFFSVGTFTASLETKLRVLWIFLIWFGFVYLLPVGINIVGELTSSVIESNYQYELKKFTKVMDFEREVIDRQREDMNGIKSLKELINQPRELLKLKALMDRRESINREIEIIENPQNRATFSPEKLMVLRSIMDGLAEQEKIEKKKVEKLPIYKQWEKAIEEKREVERRLSMIRDEMMRYYDREIFPKKIQNFENEIRDKICSNARFIEILYGLFPSTFYLSINNEISSRGYENAIAVHEYAKRIKDEFWRFYWPRKQAEVDAIRQGIRPERVERFFENNEIKREGLSNAIKGESRLPPNFWIWLAITLTWIAGVGLRSYYLYKKSLFPGPESDIPGVDELEIELNREESNVVLSRHEAIKEHLYNVLSGKDRGFKGKLIYNGIDLVSKKERSDFVYLFHPQEIPGDISIIGFVSCMGNILKASKEQLQALNKRLNLDKYKGKKFSDLDREKNDIRGKILFEVARLKKTDIYMIDDFARGMPPGFVKEFTQGLDQLKQGGSSILYLTNDLFLARRIGNYVTFLKKDADLMTVKL